jgi:hypothetical protein
MKSVTTLLFPAVILGLVLGLSGCARDGGRSNAGLAPAEGQIRPMPRPGGGALPGAGAVTVEQFDTTTAQERAAAASGSVSGEARVGRTVATLGNPADPGFWLETPLVRSARAGRVVAVTTGKSVQVELRPIAGDPGAGSRISLPALRLLEVGLTGLHELDVFAG